MSKILRLQKKLCHEFYALGRNYSWRYASYNLLWWICFYVRTGLSWNVSKWALHKKTEWLDRFVGGVIDFNLDKQPDSHDGRLLIDQFTIWVFWGQGETAMPPLVKACYGQLTRYNDQVCLVTNDNVRDYIDLPEILYEKVNDGRLTWAHFSDIVRTSLLAKYGGLWLDATVWVSGRLPLDRIMTMPLWSANGRCDHRGQDICFWTSEEWSWSGWCLSSNTKSYLLFSFVSQMLIKRAMTDEVLLDYVLIDYFIHYACRHFASVSHDMKNMIIRNPKRNALASVMDKPYNEDEYQELIASDFVFKLSYRSKWCAEKNGIQTFFGRLVSGYSHGE